MKNLNFLSIVIVLVVLVSSCKAVFEEDITDKIVTVILPLDDDTLNFNNIHFKWNEVEGASSYKLEIVSPSYSEIKKFELDSTIMSTEFYQVLQPGDYEFRLRAENGGYKGKYSKIHHFYVDSVLDLSNQSILIIAPSNNQYLDGNSDISMTWQNLYAADSYNFLLKYGEDFESSSIIDQELGIATLIKNVSSDYLLLEGKYYLCVSAINETSNSLYSYRTVLIDKTKPNTPDLISPATETSLTVGDDQVFKWNTGIDPGTINSTVYTEFQLSNSESFIEFVSTTNITVDSISYNFDSAGEYYWRVKSFDEVGNQNNEFSEVRTIIVE